MIAARMPSLRAVVREGLTVAELSSRSRAGLDRPLFGDDAELLVAVPVDEGLVLGAHQRASELGAALVAGGALHRRGSGGGEAQVGPGTVWLQLALAHSSALVPCEPGRLLNRYVRPLLRAVTRLGVIAHYFERDWVSGAKRPVAALAFAHDASTGRAMVEAIVAVTTPFALRARATTLGKAPATLAELGLRGGGSALAEALVASYVSAYGGASDLGDLRERGEFAAHVEPRAVAGEPPWTATRAEAIGLVGAGRDGGGRLRLGGELMVSRDALARLETGLAALPAAVDAATLDAAVDALVDATLGAPGVALFGVRSLRSVRDALVEALARESAARDPLAGDSPPQ
jgi:hypothetical protein